MEQAVACGQGEAQGPRRAGSACELEEMIERGPGGAAARQRDLLPLPLQFPHAFRQSPKGLSRCSLRRLHARNAWQTWANEGVSTLSQLASHTRNRPGKPSRAQAAALDSFVKPYVEMCKPPPPLTPARAFTELCHSSPPYLQEGGGGQPRITATLCRCLTWVGVPAIPF